VRLAETHNALKASFVKRLHEMMSCYMFFFGANLCNENAFVTESVCKGPDEFVVPVEEVGKLNGGTGISEVMNRVIW